MKSPTWHRLISLASFVAFLEALDGTIVIAALPKIAEDYGVEVLSLSGVVASYVVAAAVTVPISGWIASKFGPRGSFLIAALLFFFGSLLSAVAGNPESLIVARGIQGTGAALMVPLIRLHLLLRQGKEDALKIVSSLTIPYQLGALVGPAVGGVICFYCDWRDIFLLNSLLGFVLIVVGFICLPSGGDRNVLKFDLIGWIITVLSIGGLIYESISIRGNVLGASDLAIIASSLLLGCASLAWLKYAPQPVLDLSLFRYRSFYVAHVGGTLFRMGAAGTPFLLTILFQQVMHLNALSAGFMLLTNAAGAFSMKFFAQPLILKFGYRKVLIVNGVASCLSIAIWSIPPNGSLMLIYCFILFFGGFIRSLQYVAIQSLPFQEISLSELPDANSLTSVVQKLGAAFGILVAAQFVTTLQTLLDLNSSNPLPLALSFSLLAALCVLALPFFVSLAAASKPCGCRKGY